MATGKKETISGLAIYRQRVTAQKHQSILEAAHKVFLEDGFHRAQVSIIARIADVSTATLYKHFRSKENLFEAVLRNAYEKFEDVAAEQASGSAREAIFRLMAAFVRQHKLQNADGLLRIAWMEVPCTADLAREIFERQSISRHLALRQLLDQLVEKDYLASHDTELGARQISGIVKEALVWPSFLGIDSGPAVDADEIIKQAIETYIARFAGKVAAQRSKTASAIDRRSGALSSLQI